jgi:hypothetical protein
MKIKQIFISNYFSTLIFKIQNLKIFGIYRNILKKIYIYIKIIIDVK